MGQVSCSMVFRLGKLKVRANFEGGSLTSQGILPATFQTSDTLIQHVIESSEKYRNGTVKIDSVIDLAEEVEDETPTVAPTPTNT